MLPFEHSLPSDHLPLNVMSRTQPSAIPTFYWITFGFYEPFLALGGSIGALLYPKQVRRACCYCKPQGSGSLNFAL